MSIRHLNIRDLAYLCAIAEYQHFGRAAQACAITQPALSERIRRIEDALGTVVFERTKRSVLLTPAGQSIVDRARNILHEAEAIDAMARASRTPQWRIPLRSCFKNVTSADRARRTVASNRSVQGST
jgi:LysR family transcriptional regulator, hydrogen peroxide-inducible genes activator